MIRKIAFATLLACTAASAGAKPVNAPDLAALKKLGTVDERYQSYNIEMVEVTGGRFWAPYGGPPGEMYRMRPPVDLADPKLRAFARQLGPVYMRVSGTWANSTYVPLAGETVGEAPAGFKQVLTRDQWRGVIAFAKAVDATLVTSFAASDGTRDASGAWTPVQAQRLVDLTREAGGTIAAAEFFNEPNIPSHGSLPKGYGTADYIRDFKLFQAWAKAAVPDMKIVGHGGVAEGSMMQQSEATLSRGFLNTEDFMKGLPASLDVVAYHFYGGVSQRCGGSPLSAKDKALTPEWLDHTLLDQAHYTALRDRYEPGKPLWLNETAQAACGGSPWAASFLDSFRYLNQLGLLAQKGVQSVMHNTLAASDYGLIDQDTLTPRPNYWAAVLWRRTMGATVLASPPSPAPELRLYAHCLPGRNGGVGLVAINAGSAAHTVALKGKAKAWVMTGEPLDTRTVKVNGQTPTLDTKGEIVGLGGVDVKRGLAVPGQSIAFASVPGAKNPACR